MTRVASCRSGAGTACDRAHLAWKQAVRTRRLTGPLVALKKRAAPKPAPLSHFDRETCSLELNLGDENADLFGPSGVAVTRDGQFAFIGTGGAGAAADASAAGVFDCRQTASEGDGRGGAGSDIRSRSGAGRSLRGNFDRAAGGFRRNHDFFAGRAFDVDRFDREWRRGTGRFAEFVLAFVHRNRSGLAGDGAAAVNDRFRFDGGRFVAGVRSRAIGFRTRDGSAGFEDVVAQA